MMSKNIAHKLGQGIAPQDFIDGMTVNRDKLTNWYDRFVWDEDKKAAFQQLRNRRNLRCAIIASDWCGDVVRNLPVVLKVVEEAGIPTEIFIMEQHLDLIDQFLTLGGRAIPKVLFTNQDGNVLAEWGPRPAYVQEPMVRFKQENPDPKAPDYDEKKTAAYEEILKRYGKGTDYQKLIVDELYSLLSAI
ncbi:hypothetical protein CathTA2_0690 [Caldalkalibacillus thermarum TA2.A1]|uniref:Thioredoxin n=2 Tax=Caldalkalibacillus thermarum (strain TA2.A1) TaxID=986075 RepID=F5L4H7_CALTT|nr:hypothetical protein CathTA2_0690 [Caldalkalibacillus thermarum TA2.A1]